MGKQRKSKNQHLSDAEVWDDSALIHSWDEAVAEYEYYHSIHARGENVEEVLRQAEIEESTDGNVVALSGKHVLPSDDRDGNEFEDGEVEDGDHDSTVAPALEEHTSDEKDISSAGLKTNGANDIKHSDAKEALPTANTINQTLENIKMAYWWAGYYSGLYEAQQQAAPL